MKNFFKNIKNEILEFIFYPKYKCPNPHCKGVMEFSYDGDIDNMPHKCNKCGITINFNK